MVEVASVANAAFKRLIFSELNPPSKGGVVHVSVRRRMLAARLRILTVPGAVRVLKPLLVELLGVPTTVKSLHPTVSITSRQPRCNRSSKSEFAAPRLYLGPCQPI
jgi:hypothetical protein